MIRWLRWRSSRALLAAGWLAMSGGLAWAAPAAESEPIKFKVVAVNPSDTVKTTDVKLYLPQEVTPRDVLDMGGLDLEYDDEKSSYYVYKERLELPPNETKIYTVVVRDLWLIPQAELTSLEQYTGLVLGRLEKTEYLESGKAIADSIRQRLQEIASAQTDPTATRRRRIGAYRIHRQTLAQIKEDLSRMEKLLTFTGGPPVPQMLQESRIKSDAPSTKTTWLLIIMIMGFVGLLGGLFFFTWHRKAQFSKELDTIRVIAFPGAPPDGDGKGHAPPAESPSKVA